MLRSNAVAFYDMCGGSGRSILFALIGVGDVKHHTHSLSFRYNTPHPLLVPSHSHSARLPKGGIEYQYSVKIRKADHIDLIMWVK